MSVRTTPQNLIVSWKGEYSGALIGSAQLTLQIYNGTAWVDDPATMNLNIFNNSRTQIVALPGNYNNNSEAKLRIKATSVGDGPFADANLYLDNLIISSGAPKIKMYSDSNVEIPNNADAATGYNTVFGDLQTLLAPGESKTYRVRNWEGTVGSNLNVTSIQIEPASGTSVNDFVVQSTSNITGLTAVSAFQTGGWFPSDTPFGTVTIRFIPQGEGVRQATVRVYSNGTPSPYSFTVIGGGRSCDIRNTAYVINTADIGVQTLTSDLGTSDFVGGTTTTNVPNGSLTAFYPRPATGSYNLFTSSSTSWFTKNVEKTKTFGGIDISNLKNVSVEFNVAAFADKTSNGVNSGDYVILSVYINGNWYDVMQLNGSNNSTKRQYQFNTTGKIYIKNYAA